jgi:hypothetical protein
MAMVRSARVRGWAAALACAAPLAPAGCESEHVYYDVAGEDAAPPDEAAAEAADGGVPVEHDCGSAGGVAVEGEVRFDGTPAETAHLYVAWMRSATTPGMPLCFVEVLPVGFPARFGFTGVERGATWALTAMLDAAGDMMPGEGDFVASIAEGTIDLSGDVSGLVLVLEPYEP